MINWFVCSEGSTLAPCKSREGPLLCPCLLINLSVLLVSFSCGKDGIMQDILRLHSALLHGNKSFFTTACVQSPECVSSADGHRSLLLTTLINKSALDKFGHVTF